MKKNTLLLHLLFPIFFIGACSNNNETNTEKIAKEKPTEINENQELFNTLKIKDSLLFQIGFNQIDTALVASLLSDDFEFYHDINGIINSKNEFVSSINDIAGLPFKTWRTLQENSMKVFPLYDNDKLYGGIQEGVHDFYQQHEGETAVKSGTAKFTHLWILEDNQWKLKRVLSYDHTVPE